MAIFTVGSDGKAPAGAQPGDQIVTGGGIYEIGPDGSGNKIADLSGLIGKATTGSSVDVARAAQILRGQSAGSSGGAMTGGVSAAAVVGSAQPETGFVGNIDVNGIGEITDYNPADYGGSSATTSASWGNVIGYIVLALVGIAVLDRFMNKGRK